MRELLLEYILLEELLDAHAQERLSQDLVDAWPPPGIDRQHLVDEVAQLLAEVRWQRAELATNDVHRERVHIEPFEGRPKRAHLVQHDADAPDVRLEGVRPALNDLWRQVVRRADHRFRLVYRMAEHARDAEVADLDDALLRQKHILALQIAVQNFAVVHVLHAEADLREPVEELALGEVAPALVLDSLGQVAAVRVVHHDAEVALFGLVRFAEPHNTGVVANLQNLRLFQSLESLTLRHFFDHDLFNDRKLFVTLTLDEERFTKSALAEQLDFVVDLELRRCIASRLQTGLIAHLFV